MKKRKETILLEIAVFLRGKLCIFGCIYNDSKLHLLLSGHAKEIIGNKKKRLKLQAGVYKDRVSVLQKKKINMSVRNVSYG